MDDEEEESDEEDEHEDSGTYLQSLLVGTRTYIRYVCFIILTVIIIIWSLFPQPLVVFHTSAVAAKKKSRNARNKCTLCFYYYRHHLIVLGLFGMCAISYLAGAHGHESDMITDQHMYKARVSPFHPLNVMVCYLLTRTWACGCCRGWRQRVRAGRGLPVVHRRAAGAQARGL